MMRLGLIRSAVLGFFAFGVACGGGPAQNCCTHNKNPQQCQSRCQKLPPKNVIILIADGAGFNHYKAADFYRCGKFPCQIYEFFPVRLAMSTYPAGGAYDANVIWSSFDYVANNPTDSAAAATAMAAGVKTYNAAIGVDLNGSPVLNLLERAEQLGKATGVITTVPFSHATPAGFVAHNVDRDNYTQIADEMVNKSAADVIMGCGNPFFGDDAKTTTPGNYKYVNAAVWTALMSGTAGGDADGDGIPDPWKLIQTRAEFQALASGPTPKRVFGVAQTINTLQEYRSGDVFALPFQVPLSQTMPTLAELTSAALNVLDEDPNGFFLMIEGGAADWAAHENRSGRLVEEMIDFNKAVVAVMNWVRKNSNWGQTLVIVTADHETGHLTGPGSGQTPNGPVFNELVNNADGNLPGMEWHSGSHTNSLVPFFAKGAGSRLFKKTIDGNDPVRGPYIDNTDIAKVIFSLWAQKPAPDCCRKFRRD